MTEKPYTAIVVSETHWDRAWYLPFETFRMRLVRLIDRVLRILDTDPDFVSFMLDGQMIPIEDYLEIRPERRADLERHARSGKLVIGPWYALADEYLVSPEALIRNLIVGMRMAEQLGPCMREGYVPDAFGHINQLPQILAGFGIRSAVFWRGIGMEGDALGNEFWWKAANGTRVLAVHLPDGYHNASNLGYPMRWGDKAAMRFDMELAMEQLRISLDTLIPRARTPNLLLMNGIDHAEAQTETPAVIAYANNVLPDVQIEHATLPEYVDRVLAANGELPAFTGEFNSGRYSVVLQGVYSTRMYIKQANERVQNLLERYAEPLAAWAWTLDETSPGGAQYPWAFLDRAWRRLMQNHPHDDICGCSVDEVHRENMVRFDDAEQVGAAIARDSFRTIAGHVDRSQPGVPFIVYNPLAWPYSGTVETSLLFDRFDPTAKGFRVVDRAGRAVPSQVLGLRDYFSMEVLKGNRKQEARVALSLDDLPSCGYRVLYAVPNLDCGAQAELARSASAAPAEAGAPAELAHSKGETEIADPVALLPNGMENRWLRVEINADGTLDITSKADGAQHYRRLGYFEDTEDAGDEYDYSPAANSQTITSQAQQAASRIVHAGPLQVTWEVSTVLSLPAALAADRRSRSEARVGCPITSLVTLRRDSRSVDIQATVENRASDHRLRVRFPSGIATDVASAGGHFDVITRPIDLPETEGWAQPPVPTKHQRGFVDLSDGRNGLAMFSRGLPEYEVLREGGNTIAVTLLRCVGAISRGDMLSRPSHAGIPCETPEGQCHGTHTFEYAIYPHAGGWESVYKDAAVYQAGIYLRRGDETEGYLPEEVWADNNPDVLHGEFVLDLPSREGELPGQLSFLSLEPASLVLSAVKRSEPGRFAGEALIVRFYNPTAEPISAALRTYLPIEQAWAANLNEEPQSELTIEGENALSLPVGGKQVCTVAIQF